MFLVCSSVFDSLILEEDKDDDDYDTSSHLYEKIYVQTSNG